MQPFLRKFLGALGNKELMKIINGNFKKFIAPLNRKWSKSILTDKGALCWAELLFDQVEPSSGKEDEREGDE